MANSQTTEKRMEPIIELQGVDKVFGKVTVLQVLSFKLFQREVLFFFGDSGGGKSTLIKILSGVHRPTRGEFRFLNAPVELDSPRQALDLGIATVFQDLAMLTLMRMRPN